MKVSAILTQTGGRWLAHCEEVDRAGEGDTPELAVAALREALSDYFRDVQAVAPPSADAVDAIEIDVVGLP